MKLLTTLIQKKSRDLFFIPSERGSIFAIYHHSLNSSALKDHAILYIHPFADEMNKSRRMASLQAKSFVSAGFGVLQIDLSGCGDSKGEFGDATWNIWKDNISTAVHWLIEKGYNCISLWGLRMGALLMMDWAKDSLTPIEKFIFWQPVLNGGVAINQFFRLASASKMMGKGGESSKEIRERLNQGQIIEIGGYELNHELVNTIEKIKMNDLCPSKGSRIIWKEISLNDPAEIGPASSNLIDVFENNGCRIEKEAITGGAFWNSVEISTLPGLIMSTTNSMICD